VSVLPTEFYGFLPEEEEEEVDGNDNEERR
jgi:hypothetical protein